MCQLPLKGQAIDSAKIYPKIGPFAAHFLRACFENISGGLAAGRGDWLRCSSVTDFCEYAPSSRLAIRPFALAIPCRSIFKTRSYNRFTFVARLPAVWQERSQTDNPNVIVALSPLAVRKHLRGTSYPGKTPKIASDKLRRVNNLKTASQIQPPESAHRW